MNAHALMDPSTDLSDTKLAPKVMYNMRTMRIEMECVCNFENNYIEKKNTYICIVKQFVFNH